MSLLSHWTESGSRGASTVPPKTMSNGDSDVSATCPDTVPALQWRTTLPVRRSMIATWLFSCRVTAAMLCVVDVDELGLGVFGEAHAGKTLEQDRARRPGAHSTDQVHDDHEAGLVALGPVGRDVRHDPVFDVLVSLVLDRDDRVALVRADLHRVGLAPEVDASARSPGSRG